MNLFPNTITADLKYSISIEEIFEIVPKQILINLRTTEAEQTLSLD